MVLVLAKCGKISNTQVAMSTVTTVLKKVVPAVKKSYDSYHEKSCPSCQEKLFALGKSKKGQMGDFRLLGEVIHHLLYGFG